MEGRSHRTKKELRERERAEQAFLTQISLKEAKEVKEKRAAHKEFLRLYRLLEKIEKADDLYGAVINRYCLLAAEVQEFTEKREEIYTQLCRFQAEGSVLIKDGKLTHKEFYSLENAMQKNLVSLDRQVQTKRRMLFDIEKENIMTIASSLRSVPKKGGTKSNPLKEALQG